MVVLPGTEGMREYRDWRFHAVGFARGTGVALIGALLCGAVAVAIEALVARAA
ncbi:hypothetical protein [Microbacterium ulmi]|uniref:Uncharacterized protein n=1 Tax=Microbacterium ulmi TaxID=179095 RepID=A0A7Y2M2T0_9MICO|nr:hypothetical protein [Microbacterium ulmi]NII68872.1 hypothetical protein [Microbacterium ulmi]NNH05132.1 hypothetical protein [Microbacterium ulmi]